MKLNGNGYLVTGYSTTNGLVTRYVNTFENVEAWINTLAKHKDSKFYTDRPQITSKEIPYSIILDNLKNDVPSCFKYVDTVEVYQFSVVQCSKIPPL